MTPDLSTRLAEWQRIAREATPGPWFTGDGVRRAVAVRSGLHRDAVCDIEREYEPGCADATHIATWSPDRALLVVEALKAAHNYCKLEAKDFQVRGELFRDLCNALAALDSPPQEPPK